MLYPLTEKWTIFLKLTFFMQNVPQVQVSLIWQLLTTE